MTSHNQGYDVEKRMCSLLHGTRVHYEEIDVETRRYMYEIKSCRLLRFQGKKNSLGRFKIVYRNHLMLRTTAVAAGKIPKYLFVIVVGRQAVRKSVSWHTVDQLLIHNKPETQVPIRKIFEVML